MGCRFTFSPTKSEEKILHYEKFIKRTRLSYMNNSPLSCVDNENNPQAWNSFIIERLKKLDHKGLWQSYTSELIKLVVDKPLEQYMRPINTKSWLSLVENQKQPDDKAYKTSYTLPKNSKFIKEVEISEAEKYQLNIQIKEIKRLKERLLTEITAPSHIISEILAKFSELFLNKYLIFFDVDPKHDLEMISRSFKEDILILMNLLRDMVEKWYMNIIIQNTSLAKSRRKRQEFLDYLINLTVFSNSNNIYYTLLNLYGLLKNEEEKKMDYVMEKLKDIKPENLEINPVFALFHCKEPYNNVINLINEQSTGVSPLEKFGIICKLKEEIKESVEVYWEEQDPNIPAQKLMIDPDQLLTIVTFSVIKARNCKIVSYLEMVKEFVNKNLLLESYYFTTYDGAVNYVLKFKEEDINSILEKAKKKSNINMDA